MYETFFSPQFAGDFLMTYVFCCFCFVYLFLWNVIHIWSQFIWLSVNNYKTRSDTAFRCRTAEFFIWACVGLAWFDLVLTIPLQYIYIWSIKNSLTNLDTFYRIPHQNQFFFHIFKIILKSLMGFYFIQTAEDKKKAWIIFSFLFWYLKIWSWRMVAPILFNIIRGCIIAMWIVSRHASMEWKGFNQKGKK